jgi:prevent-host-death family protein
MQVNILEAKNQLSKLVKAAAAGEEVIIASNGKPVAKLVALEERRGLRGWGKLKIDRADLDAAFSEQTDEEITRLFESR